MEMNGFLGGLYKLGEWIIRLVYVNILWILFILVGGIALGIMPSTAALFAIMRKWMIGDENLPVFKTYWHSYKKEFTQSNIIGLILGILLLIFYIDYRVILISQGASFQILALFLIIILFLFTLMCLYIFPVFVSYELKLVQYFKYSFLFAFASPLSTVFMIIGLFFSCILAIIVPGLIVFLGVSAPAFIIMASANRAFEKVKHKVQQHPAHQDTTNL
ncbi:YesL family protein [Lederbergia wuyishanensis]|uniref:Membrane protein YesL n=1 Tax=Lederbergia wuyishanensis TaxID=1347903 RepID=A0ABU0D7P3_9BACI|nr:YesL family protein [Lederbergia wuyishanensis]MCJ8009082.1 YesL family protein [Lederbergia wuyishanensis]MDQ0344419.1 putative membrane protein YesL [Lederbergia wuyishanensis]